MFVITKWKDIELEKLEQKQEYSNQTIKIEIDLKKEFLFMKTSRASHLIMKNKN